MVGRCCNRRSRWCKKLFVLCIVLMLLIPVLLLFTTQDSTFWNPYDEWRGLRRSNDLPDGLQDMQLDTLIVEPPVLRSTMGNFEPPPEDERRQGAGEYGRPVMLNPSDQEKYDQSFKEYGFNMVISDRIALDRTVNDIRQDECRYWHYPTNLPNTSVVVVFHNEGWSTLLRTVHSIINTSPPNLLQEVILVDDFSDKSHLQARLQQYIDEPQFQGKVKLYRNSKREGLIRSRIFGAEQSRGQVVTFLDAHCECSPNWLVPLLTEIALNRTTVVCPTVDSISADTFEYRSQGDGMCRGAMDWDFWYKRIPVDLSRKRLGLKYQSEPYDSPIMAGGLFAIDREYFFEIGAYDPGLQIWGGENFEISFKIWMCGGSLKFVPCSRVGHVYRKGVPYTYPDSGVPGVSVIHMNYMRVAEVWMDDFKEYFYTARPDLRGKPYGDIGEQIRFRRHNCPKSFKWFMEEIAFDSLEKFPPPPPNKGWGEIKSVHTGLCVDSMGHQDTAGGEAGVYYCHGMGGNQRFRFTGPGQIILYDYCFYVDGTRVRIDKCNRVRYSSFWDYDEVNQRFQLKNTNKCLDHNSNEHTIFVNECDNEKGTQQFQINPPEELQVQPKAVR
ncbi:N-acetylgalactosaminyltransferase 7-like [Lytechinus pictus]|uniref:N-acetylgalactosaminyltransferase 7-like n=1 Tax=Lytechinus pictus TaxID=7653 RepID=UPI0030B9C54A